MTYHQDHSQYFESGAPQARGSRKAQARHERRQNSATRNSERLREPLVPRSQNQAEMCQALLDSAQIFAVGPAGTGKTYIASRHALRQVLSGTKERVVICRATVAKSKHRLGFRPGNQDEKIADWLVPIMDGFKAEASVSTIEKLRRDGKIEFLAFETMRGRSLGDSVVLLDEAQNCDLGDLRMFLTRIGEGSQVIVSGDLDQIDIPDSGLAHVLDMIETFDLGADIIEFGADDVVRSVVAREWVKAFAEESA